MSEPERERRKQRSHRRIVDVAAEDIRKYGLGASGVKAIMRRAGLTHGGFYNHFPDKTAMLEEAFRRAARYREDWLADLAPKDDCARLELAVERYLSLSHRDQPENGCPHAALAGDVARETAILRAAFEEELLETVRRLCAELFGAEPEERRQECALALLSLCVGAVTLARAVPDPATAEAILAAARRQALAFADGARDPGPPG